MCVAEKHLRQVARAALRAVEARAELRQAILLARASGETLDAIGRAAGLSRQRVAQILREGERR
jgi:DNA-directed RNA polymerase sigma subunit (sigma70/sigma32)